MAYNKILKILLNVVALAYPTQLIYTNCIFTKSEHGFQDKVNPMEALEGKNTQSAAVSGSQCVTPYLNSCIRILAKGTLKLKFKENKKLILLVS